MRTAGGYGGSRSSSSRLYDSFLLSPLVAGVMLITRPSGTERNQMTALAALCAMLMLVLVRGNLNSRLPDLGGQSPARRLFEYARRLPDSLTKPWFALQDPVAWWESDGITDTRAVARWLRECRKPDDRVLLFGYYLTWCSSRTGRLPAARLPALRLLFIAG